MTNIKLEVGQVWKSRKDNGSTYEVLKTFHCIDGFEWLCYFYKNEKNNDTSCNCRQISTFTRNRTLITNPDGTPHVKPNDYQAGDVWVFYGTSRTPGSAYLIISGRNGLMVLCDYKKDATPMEEMSLIANPINYKLIHRIGVIL